MSTPTLPSILMSARTDPLPTPSHPSATVGTMPTNTPQQLSSSCSTTTNPAASTTISLPRNISNYTNQLPGHTIVSLVPSFSSSNGIPTIPLPLINSSHHPGHPVPSPPPPGYPMGGGGPPSNPTVVIIQSSKPLPPVFTDHLGRTFYRTTEPVRSSIDSSAINSLSSLGFPTTPLPTTTVVTSTNHASNGSVNSSSTVSGSTPTAVPLMISSKVPLPSVVLSRPSNGYRGVTFVSSSVLHPWKVTINHAGTSKELGYFATETEAAKVYDKEARKLHGDKARLNFPSIGERSSMGRSSYRGISWQPKCSKWEVRIKHQGRMRYLGVYVSELEAARAWDIECIKLRGIRNIDSKKLNFPDAVPEYLQILLEQQEQHNFQAMEPSIDMDNDTNDTGEDNENFDSDNDNKSSSSLLLSSVTSSSVILQKSKGNEYNNMDQYTNTNTNGPPVRSSFLVPPSTALLPSHTMVNTSTNRSMHTNSGNTITTTNSNTALSLSNQDTNQWTKRKYTKRPKIFDNATEPNNDNNIIESINPGPEATYHTIPFSFTAELGTSSGTVSNNVDTAGASLKRKYSSDDDNNSSHTSTVSTTNENDENSFYQSTDDYYSYPLSYQVDHVSKVSRTKNESSLPFASIMRTNRPLDTTIKQLSSTANVLSNEKVSTEPPKHHNNITTSTNSSHTPLPSARGGAAALLQQQQEISYGFPSSSSSTSSVYPQHVSSNPNASGETYNPNYASTKIQQPLSNISYEKVSDYAYSIMPNHMYSGAFGMNDDETNNTHHLLLLESDSSHYGTVDTNHGNVNTNFTDPSLNNTMLNFATTNNNENNNNDSINIASTYYGSSLLPPIGGTSNYQQYPSSSYYSYDTSGNNYDSNSNTPYLWNHPYLFSDSTYSAYPCNTRNTGSSSIYSSGTMIPSSATKDTTNTGSRIGTNTTQNANTDTSTTMRTIILPSSESNYSFSTNNLSGSLFGQVPYRLPDYYTNNVLNNPPQPILVPLSLLKDPSFLSMNNVGTETMNTNSIGPTIQGLSSINTNPEAGIKTVMDTADNSSISITNSDASLLTSLSTTATVNSTASSTYVLYPVMVISNSLIGGLSALSQFSDKDTKILVPVTLSSTHSYVAPNSGGGLTNPSNISQESITTITSNIFH